MISNSLVSLGLLPFTNKNEPWVLSRTACLGTDTLQLLQQNKKLPKVYNYQKARVDYLTELQHPLPSTLAYSKELVPLASIKVFDCPTIFTNGGC